MKVNVEVPDQMIADLLDSAVSQYWARIISYPDGLEIVQGKSQAVIDEMGDEDKPIAKHTLTARKIARGLKVMAEKFPHHFSDVLSDGKTSDAYTGDAIIQCALFNDLRYG